MLGAYMSLEQAATQQLDGSWAGSPQGPEQSTLRKGALSVVQHWLVGTHIFIPAMEIVTLGYKMAYDHSP